MPYRSSVRLDVCHTAATVTTERRRASVICEGVGVAYYATHRLGQLELVDLVLHVGHAVAGDGVEDLLCLLCHSLLGGSGVDRAVIIDGVDTALCSAAAFCELRLRLVKTLLNGRAELACLVERLIAETADRIVILACDCLLLVTESPDCILEAIEVHGITQAGFSHGLLTSVTVATEAVATPTEDHRKEDDHPLCIVAAEAGLAGSGRDVGK